MREKKYFSLTLDMSISDMSFRHIKKNNDSITIIRLTGDQEMLSNSSPSNRLASIENNTQHVVTITVWSR